MGSERTVGVRRRPRRGPWALQAGTGWRGQEPRPRESDRHASPPSPWALTWEAEVQPRGRGARGEACPARPRRARPRCGEHRREARGARGPRRAALPQVQATPGRPGLDARRGDALPDVLTAPWLAIKAQGRQGTSQPRAITRGERPTPGSPEHRQLGRPWGIARLRPPAGRPGLPGRWAPPCAAVSDGLRPGRCAPQARAQAPASLAPGSSAVVASDGEQWFDRVCPDRRRSRLAQRSPEQGGLTRIRGLLPAGM